MADATAPSGKPVHTIVLDAGPIIKNTPPLSTLLAQCDEIITTPAVVNEIRDPDARARVETLYLPFLKQRTPTPKSFNVISEFARKTGDRSVLSRVDIEVLALAYEIECERNGGDWRLRSVPGQKRVNGRPPVKEEDKKEEGKEEESAPTEKEATNEEAEASVTDKKGEEEQQQQPEEETTPSSNAEIVAENIEAESTIAEEYLDEENEEDEEEDDAADSDGGEWITPTNYKKRLARDESGASGNGAEPKTMQVATMTTDFACQNVLLQMNLNLLSTTTLQRVQHLKSFIKRCHGCFLTTKEMNKQFCPRCGKDTLTRVSCTTTANGQFTMHLKKNMQWNNRGNRFPDLPPLVTFTTDVFHPLIVPLTTYTFSTGSASDDPVSATDEERLPPGGFSLRHGFPHWFGRAKRNGIPSGKSSRTVSGQSLGAPSGTRTGVGEPDKTDIVATDSSDTVEEPPGPASTDITVPRVVQVPVSHQLTMPRTHVPVAELLAYIRSTFDDEEVLDSLPQEAAGNPGAWHAWRAHRRGAIGPTGLKRDSPQARLPGDWHWDGIWARRVRDEIEASHSDPMLFGNSTRGSGEEMIRFSRLDEATRDVVKDKMRMTVARVHSESG